MIKKIQEKIDMIRNVENEIVKLYPDQQIRCPVHLCLGQENIAAGVISALNEEDIVFSTHRSHGHYIAKGGNIKKFFDEIYGKKTGCCKGRGGSMHLIDKKCGFYGSTSIVGGIIPVAVGAAFSMKLQGSKRRVVVFFGDGATEEGVFHESLNFASLHKLNILFVCENNELAVETPISERQPNRPIANIAVCHNIYAPSPYEINDANRIYQKTKLALQELPAFIEFKTTRLKEHCGPNDNKRR